MGDRPAIAQRYGANPVDAGELLLKSEPCRACGRYYHNRDTSWIHSKAAPPHEAEQYRNIRRVEGTFVPNNEFDPPLRDDTRIANIVPTDESRAGVDETYRQHQTPLDSAVHATKGPFSSAGPSTSSNLTGPISSGTSPNTSSHPTAATPAEFGTRTGAATKLTGIGTSTQQLQRLFRSTLGSKYSSNDQYVHRLLCQCKKGQLKLKPVSS